MMCLRRSVLFLDAAQLDGGGVKDSLEGIKSSLHIGPSTFLNGFGFTNRLDNLIQAIAQRQQATKGK